MSGCIYGGGEDVGALVFDPGHHSLRAGFAGEEMPKCEIPSVVGYAFDPAAQNGSAEPNQPGEKSITKKNYYVGTHSLSFPRANCEVASCMKDGMIDDWDMFEQILDFSYKNVLFTESELHPALFSESPWNQKFHREKLTELMFEKYNVPAFNLTKNAVLTTFANGRSSGLVLDGGATHTSAVPVHDGYVLQRAVVTSSIGGDFLTMLCNQHLESRRIELVAPYQIASKQEVNDDEPAVWKKRLNLPEVKPSWHNYMIKQVLQDFQASVLQVVESPYDEESCQTIPQVSHEFPNGYRQDFGTERFRIAEALIDPSKVRTNISQNALGAAHAVTTSVGMCDIDVRPGLYGSVILTGGTTTMQGFPERLSRDLAYRAPSSMKFKLIAAPGVQERRFGAWIGGSILGSLGSFHQMWMTKQEYEENGKSQIDRKCP